jgi:uncharacterized protein
MVDPELLQILVCPDTKDPVRLADAELLAKVNAAISAGDILNQGGKPVRKTLEGGLVREDRKVLYPIVDDIPVMLVDEALSLETIS